MKRKVPQNEASFLKIDRWFLVHCVILSALLTSHFFDWISFSVMIRLIGSYLFMFTYIFIFGHYKALQQLKVYLLWLSVGILQLIVYLKYKSLPEFLNDAGVNITPLLGLFVFLVLYQIFRQISLYFNHEELMIDLKVGVFKDEPSAVDIVASIVIFSVTLLCLIVH